MKQTRTIYKKPEKIHINWKLYDINKKEMQRTQVQERIAMQNLNLGSIYEAPTREEYFKQSEERKAFILAEREKNLKKSAKTSLQKLLNFLDKKLFEACLEKEEELLEFDTKKHFIRHQFVTE